MVLKILLAILVISTAEPVESVRIEEPVPVVVEPAYTQSEAELMACVVQAEYGYGDEKDKRLVASVILNRVEHPDFPDTITEVIYQPNQFVVSGYYTQDTLDAVYKELEERTDNRVLWFSSAGYQPYGVPLFQYNSHYFSGY